MQIGVSGKNNTDTSKKTTRNILRKEKLFLLISKSVFLNYVFLILETRVRKKSLKKNRLTVCSICFVKPFFEVKMGRGSVLLLFS